METYKLKSPNSNGVIAKVSKIKELDIPPMSEGSTISGNYTYVLFESASAKFNS